MEVRQTIYGGRSYHAARALLKGEVLLRELPAVSAVYGDFRKEVCAYCWRYCYARARPAARAPSTDVAASDRSSERSTANGVSEAAGSAQRAADLPGYGKLWPYRVGESSRACSPLCQTRALARSSSEAPVQDWLDRIPSLRKRHDARSADGVRVDWDWLRLAFDARRLRELGADGRGDGSASWEELVGLQDDWPAVTTSERAQMRRVADVLAEMFPHDPADHFEMVRTVVGRSRCNCFGIWELYQTPLPGCDDAESTEGDDMPGESFPEAEMLGWGVYPRSSYFNHSCTPNVKKVRKGRTLEFVPMREIADGEELLISYLGDRSYNDGTERRAALKEWGFDCMCAQCRSEQGLA